MDLSQFRLATGRRPASGLGAGIGSRSPFAIGPIPAKMHIQNSVAVQDDAVKKTLRSQRRRSSTEIETENTGAPPQSGVRSMLTEIRSLTDRMKALRASQSLLAAGSEQSTAVDREIAALDQMRAA